MDCSIGYRRIEAEETLTNQGSQTIRQRAQELRTPRSRRVPTRVRFRPPLPLFDANRAVSPFDSTQFISEEPAVLAGSFFVRRLTERIEGGNGTIRIEQW